MSDLLMVFDTETTGRTDFKASYDASHQPNLIQLGYKIYDVQNREVIYEVGHLVNTTEHHTYKMEPEAQQVHGISTEMVKKWGISPDVTMKAFLVWLDRCKYVVAHNIQFDISVLQCFAARHKYNPGLFSQKSQHCTMRITTNTCRIPSARGGFKWPKLSEAFEHYFPDQVFSGAHNALVDVNACGDIMWKLVDNGDLAFR